MQVTGAEGAEGKDHLVFLNSGEVNNVLMGSLAGPESPRPCSHRIKLRAAAIPRKLEFELELKSSSASRSPKE